MNIHVETERFILRDIEISDLEGMFDLDSNVEVHEFLGNQPIKTMDEAKEAIDYIRNQYAKNNIGRWAVVDKETNDFIGWSGLKYEQKVRENFDYFDIGYRLRKKYWGKGIATETAIAALQYGFKELNLDEICGGAHIHNEASNKVLKKIGLNFIETFEFDGALHNWYAIKKAEWLVKNIQ